MSKGTSGPVTHAMRASLLRPLAALLLFGISFGYVEAAVVAYLRALYEPIHERLHPDRASGDLFPVLRLDELEAFGPEHVRRVHTELAREAATLAMLAAVALAVAHNFRQWFAAFMIAFGVWDIFFYVFLHLLTGWPASLLDWDLLFLLPVSWVGPVLSPVLVALSMTAAGVVVLWRESVGRPLLLTWYDWAAILGGGLVVVVAFCWDCRNTMTGGVPNAFNWPLLGVGLGVGLAGVLHALSGR